MCDLSVLARHDMKWSEADGQRQPCCCHTVLNEAVHHHLLQAFLAQVQCSQVFCFSRNVAALAHGTTESPLVLLPLLHVKG